MILNYWRCQFNNVNVVQVLSNFLFLKKHIHWSIVLRSHTCNHLFLSLSFPFQVSCFNSRRKVFSFQDICVNYKSVNVSISNQLFVLLPTCIRKKKKNSLHFCRSNFFISILFYILFGVYLWWCVYIYVFDLGKKKSINKFE